MTAKPTLFKRSLIQATTLTALLITACSNHAPTAAPLLNAETPLPPIRTLLECLPPEAALVAAHRATAMGLSEPENSISALEKLISHGTLMAEIDIAAIRDGTPIIFHDGVWDDHASGAGPVVATSSEAFARLRLKDAKGSVGGEPVPTLAAMLDAAKDRIYLEIDFKTSADIETIINLIREREMVDQVVLIATDDSEAEALTPYAGEFLMSLPRARKRLVANAKQGVWIGGGWRDGDEKRIQDRHYVIGAQWKKNPAQLAKAARALDILVTDQALRYEPVAGLKTTGAFRACLKADTDRAGTDKTGTDAD